MIGVITTSAAIQAILASQVGATLLGDPLIRPSAPPPPSTSPEPRP